MSHLFDMAELQILKKTQNSFTIKIFSRLWLFLQTDKKINLLKKQTKKKQNRIKQGYTFLSHEYNENFLYY